MQEQNKLSASKVTVNSYVLCLMPARYYRGQRWCFTVTVTSLLLNCWTLTALKWFSNVAFLSVSTGRSSPSVAGRPGEELTRLLLRGPEAAAAAGDGRFRLVWPKHTLSHTHTSWFLSSLICSASACVCFLTKFKRGLSMRLKRRRDFKT